MRNERADITSQAFSAFWLFDVSTGGIRGLPPTSSSPEVMWQFAEFSFDRELECFVEEDDEARKRAAGGYLYVEVDREGLRALQDPEVKRQADEAYVIAWCISWLESRGQKGMDPAWVKFHENPKHKSMTRDDWFRPAWKKAKHYYLEKISREIHATPAR